MRSSKYGLGLAVAASCMAFGAASASAATLSVNGATGTDGAGCGSTASPCKTIQGGVDSASAGDILNVAAGNYTDPVNVTKALTLRGAQAGRDARTRSTTPADETVVAAGGGAQFNVNAAGIRVDGFTFTSAIWTYGVANTTIVNNIVQTTNSPDILVSGDHAVMQHNFLDNGVNDGTGNGQNTGIATGFTGTGGLRDSQISDNKFAGHESSAVNLSNNSQNVDVTGNTFSDDSTALVAVDSSDVRFSGNTGSRFRGSAVFVGLGNTGLSIDGNDLSDGDGNGISVSTAFGGPAPSQGVDITGNSLVGFAKTNAARADISVADGSYSGALAVHYNRLSGNTHGLNNLQTSGGGTVDASDNFWGCNTGPGTAGCGDVVTTGATTTSTPFLTLNVSASPTSIFAGGETSTVRAFVAPSTGSAPADLTFPDVPVTLGSNLGTTLDAATVRLAGGSGSTLLTSGSTAGTATVTGTLDNAAPTTPVTVTAKPTNGTNGASGTNGTNGASGTNGLTPSSVTTTTKKVVVASKSVKFSKKSRKGRVQITCPRTDGLCEGTISISYKGKVIGRQAFLVRGGRSGKFTLKLSKSALKKLGKGKKVSVGVFSRDLTGAASSSSSKVKLKVAK